MGFKLKFPQSEKQNGELAAKYLFSEIRKNRFRLECQTYKPGNTQTKNRMQMHLLRDEYNRIRGSGYCNRLEQLADRVSYKLLEIVSLNPEDWNNYRRGQKFRRLDELLAEFDVEWLRSRQTPEPAE